MMFLQDSPVWNRTSNSTLQVSVNDHNVRVQCAVCANPRGNISWTFKGGELPSDIVVTDDTLLIGTITEAHFGKYSCAIPDLLHHQNEPFVTNIKLITCEFKEITCIYIFPLINEAT